MNERSATSAGRNFDVDRYLRLHAEMARIRAFEEAGVRAQKEGLVLGAIHPYIGEEAIAVGVCAHLRADDPLLSTHRGHGHALAKGANERAMMCELFGRDGGTCGGRGGSMHIADFAVGMLGANGVVSANITIAAGAAHAIKLKGDDRIVACFFGDGAINRGPFLEGLNWAAVFGLPVLFVCEDNGFAATTRTAKMTGGPGAAARAESLGIASTVVDGNDIVAVDEAVASIAASIRSRSEPHLLVAKTYRLTGHTAADAAPYRGQDEVAEAWTRDPITRCEELLTGYGVPLDRLATQRKDAEAQMQAAYEAAKAAPWPAAEGAFDYVQDVGDPRQEAF